MSVSKPYNGDICQNKPQTLMWVSKPKSLLVSNPQKGDVGEQAQNTDDDDDDDVGDRNACEQAQNLDVGEQAPNPKKKCC